MYFFFFNYVNLINYRSEIIKTKNKDDSKLLYKKAAGSKIMLIRNEKNKDVMKREESPVLDLNKLEELALKNHEPIGLKKELERLGDVLSVGLGNEKKSDKTESNDQEPVSTFDLKSGKKFNSFQKSMFYKVSRFLVNLSKNVKIGAPCCPDGHCCPYKYYDKI